MTYMTPRIFDRNKPKVRMAVPLISDDILHFLTCSMLKAIYTIVYTYKRNYSTSFNASCILKEKRRCLFSSGRHKTEQRSGVLCRTAGLAYVRGARHRSLDTKKSGSARLAPTSAGGLLGNGALCH